MDMYGEKITLSETGRLTYPISRGHLSEEESISTNNLE